MIPFLLSLVAAELIVPERHEFAVHQGDTVRLTAKGIAGSRITIKVEGPARLEREERVSPGRGRIGMTFREFYLLATDSGEAKATITVRSPQGLVETLVWKFTVR
jgi:hypothetical protein